MSKKIDSGLGNLEGDVLERRLYEILEAAGKEISDLRAGFVILKHAERIGARASALVAKVEETIPLKMRSKNFQDALAFWYKDDALYGHLCRILTEAGDDSFLQQRASYVIFNNAERLEIQKAQALVEKAIERITTEGCSHRFQMELDNCRKRLAQKQAYESLAFMYDHDICPLDKEAKLLVMIQHGGEEVMNEFLGMTKADPLDWPLSEGAMEQILQRSMDLRFVPHYDISLFEHLFEDWESWFEWAVRSFELIHVTKPEFAGYIWNFLMEALDCRDEYMRQLALFHLYERSAKMPEKLRMATLRAITNIPVGWGAGGLCERIRCLEFADQPPALYEEPMSVIRLR